jgi:hypothetical protein
MWMNPVGRNCLCSLPAVLVGWNPDERHGWCKVEEIGSIERLGGCCSPAAGLLLGRTPSAVGNDDKEYRGWWSTNLKGGCAGTRRIPPSVSDSNGDSWEEEACVPSGGSLGEETEIFNGCVRWGIDADSMLPWRRQTVKCKEEVQGWLWAYGNGLLSVFEHNDWGNGLLSERLGCLSGVRELMRRRS